jgi:hypothetical protein
MRRQSRRRETRNELVKAGQRGPNWSRACLVGSIIVYLGLATLISRWLPGESVLTWVLVLFSAHSAAYLLFHEIRGYEDDDESF